MKITLHNEFHNTTATLIPRNGRLNKRQLARAHKSLCGMSDCCCGGIYRAAPDLGEMYEELLMCPQRDSVALPSDRR